MAVNLRLNVADTLKDYDLFLTGASGFVGIAMLEKLLCVHSALCNGNIRNMQPCIYLLIRSNSKYPDVSIRLKEEMFANSLFDSYNRDDLYYLVEKKKIIAINGDITHDLLGITENDIAFMKNNTINRKNELLFCHCAANVNFNCTANQIMGENVNGTYQCIRVAAIVNCFGFLHISTLWVNCREKIDATIYEKLYKQGYNGPSLFEEWLQLSSEEERTKWLTKTFETEFSKTDPNNPTQRGYYPNFYTLTKNIAEHSVKYYCDKLNMKWSIARLGAIGPFTKQDPIRHGWYYSNGAGFVKLVAGVSLGYIKYLNCDGTGKTDFVPIDYTVNAMCAILATFDNKYYNNRNIFHDVYNIGICGSYPHLTFNDSFDYVAENKDWPYPQRITKIKSKFLFDLIHFLQYDLMLYAVTPIVYLNNIIYGNNDNIDINALNDIQKIEFELNQLDPNRLTKLAKKIESAKKLRKGLKSFHTHYTYFFNQKFVFDNSNMNELYKLMDGNSRKNFYFDPMDLDRHEYDLDVALKAAKDIEEYMKKSKIQKVKRKNELLAELNRLRNSAINASDTALQSKL